MARSYEFRFQAVLDHLDFLLSAVRFTIVLMVLSLILAVIVGGTAGQMQLSRHRAIRIPAIIYIDVFRTTPLLVQLVWSLHCLPIIFGIRLGGFWSGVLALGLNSGAFFAEIFRAGITTLGRGQTEAGLALGMTQLQVSRRVIYPQALRRMLPPLGNLAVSLMKDTSLVSVIGIAELMNAATNLTSQTFQPIEVLTVVAIIYFLLTYPIALFADYLHKRGREFEGT